MATTLIALSACTFDEFGMPETEELDLIIKGIYDSPTEWGWDSTITACSVITNCYRGIPDYIFNHLELPDIGVVEGSHVKVIFSVPSPDPVPGPLHVIQWELIE